MNREEFEERCDKIQKDAPRPTESQFEKIQTVYNYHPSIPDKESIALVYMTYGMIAIEDLLPRSEKLAELETKLREAQHKVDEVLNEMRELGGKY